MTRVRDRLLVSVSRRVCELALMLLRRLDARHAEPLVLVQVHDDNREHGQQRQRHHPSKYDEELWVVGAPRRGELRQRRDRHANAEVGDADRLRRRNTTLLCASTA
jgi:hypothetical protein